MQIYFSHFCHRENIECALFSYLHGVFKLNISSKVSLKETGKIVISEEIWFEWLIWEDPAALFSYGILMFYIFLR